MGVLAKAQLVGSRTEGRLSGKGKETRGMGEGQRAEEEKKENERQRIRKGEVTESKQDRADGRSRRRRSGE